MAKEIESRFDRDGIGLDLQQLVDRFELLIDLSRRLGVAFAEGADHGLYPRPDDVRVNADASDRAQLEKREKDVVVPRVEVEIGLLEDAPCLDGVVIRLLDRPDGRNLGELGDGLGLDVDHDSPGDVVDDDRPIADVGDRAEVLDDPAGGRLVVVGSDDEESVYTELVRFTRQVDGVSSGIGAGAGDDGALPVESLDRDAEQLEPLIVGEGGALARGAGDDGALPVESLDRDAEQLEPLIVGEGGALARGPGDDEPIGTTLDEVLREFAEALEVDRSVGLERRDDRG